MPDGYWLTKRLDAIYPGLYPYLRPEVYAPELPLSHHRNPFKGNLCLLARPTEYWNPVWTLARLLKSQLPELSKALQLEDPAALAEVEVAQGEPVSTYYPYEADSIVLVDSGWQLPPDQNTGEIEIGLMESGGPFRGIVQKISAADGTVLARAPFDLKSSQTVRGRWVRIDAPILEERPAAFFARLVESHRDAERAPEIGGVRITGAVFPEEVAHRSHADGWIFLIRTASSAPGFRPGKKVDVRFLRAAGAGLSDLSARLPEFQSLQQKRIAVFGLGCIGGPSVLEFARGGIGGLQILDHDIVDPGTAVRWPFGLSASGRLKATVLCKFVEREFPWVKTLVGISHRLGNPESNFSDGEMVERILDKADLIYDATGETGIQYLLSDLARERKIPYICVSGTHGGWGGLVARFLPDSRSGCWFCFQSALDNGEIPTPAAAPNGQVQPQGCNRLTYTGANFDLSEIALQGVRLAIATLLAMSNPNYDDYDWNIAVLNLRDSSARRVLPQWIPFDLRARETCPVCRKS